MTMYRGPSASLFLLWRVPVARVRISPCLKSAQNKRFRPTSFFQPSTNEENGGEKNDRKMTSQIVMAKKNKSFIFSECTNLQCSEVPLPCLAHMAPPYARTSEERVRTYSALYLPIIMPWGDKTVKSVRADQSNCQLVVDRRYNIHPPVLCMYQRFAL